MASFIEKLTGEISSWFGALTGRSRVDVKKMESAVEKIEEKRTIPETVAQKASKEVIPEEDSVKSDFKNASIFLSKLSSQITQKLAPFANKGSQKISNKLGAVKTSNKQSLGKIIKILIIIVALILIIIVISRIFKRVSEDGNRVQPTPKETPTPAVFVPYKPSVYANDSEVLKLEEDVNILERELARTNIKEDRLAPLQLDFRVDFID